MILAATNRCAHRAGFSRRVLLPPLLPGRNVDFVWGDSAPRVGLIHKANPEPVKITALHGLDFHFSCFLTFDKAMMIISCTAMGLWIFISANCFALP